MGPARLALAAGAGFLAVFVSTACVTKPYVRFPHAAHLAELECGKPGQPQCLSCVSCHMGAQAEGSEVWAKPTGQVCDRCHKPEEKEKIALPARPTWSRPAAYDIIFNHDQHLAMPEMKGQCVKCHQVAVSQDTERTFPSMDTCLSCHQHQQQFTDAVCAPCHQEQHVRVLRPVSFLPHDVAWPARHGTFARSEAKACAVCHAQTMCDSCHDATQTIRPEQRNPEAIGREYVHRFDYLSRHGIEARSQPGQCVSCHNMRNDCDACHTSRGVSGALINGASPHGLNWSSGSSPGQNLHGREARRDITSCAACHDQGPATNCVRCHKVGGYGGNPHPPGWSSQQSVSDGTCGACHGGGL